MPLKVLLIISDLYRSIGGGQTVYTKIIENTPEVDFFYFISEEPVGAPRPRNAKGIPIEDKSRGKIIVTSPPIFPGYIRSSLEHADLYARSVAGQSFDIVDVPDFITLGSMLKSAFNHHRVSVKRIVLAMHGNISDSMRLNWHANEDATMEVRALEKAQFENAEAIYAISPKYIKDWQRQINRPIHFVDPAAFVEVKKGPAAGRHLKSSKPSLYCIGRTERRKGNDLFIEMVRWIKPDLYDRALHIGDEVSLNNGGGSFSHLKSMGAMRKQVVEMKPSYKWAELKALFEERSIVVVPTRYDTLNLVALEAVLNGCPLVISSEAGACDYLDTYLPEVPYIKLDLKDFYGSLDKIEDLLAHYDEYRERLETALQKATLLDIAPPNFRVLYEKILSEEPAGDANKQKPIQYERATNRRKSYLEGLDLRARLKLENRLKPGDIHKLRRKGQLKNEHLCNCWADAKWLRERYIHLSNHEEDSPKRAKEKLKAVYDNTHNPLFRCNYWLELARIERSLGNELVAATYELRSIRLMGSDSTGVLPKAIRTLNEKGFQNVAEAATALYEVPEKSNERVYEFLKKSYQRNLVKVMPPAEKVEDHRSGTPKVSVIVSLYNAASKLNFFLTCLNRQTLSRLRGQVEVILVDSGSPDREYEVIKEFVSKTPLNMLYVRSATRETIQAAWNRGIALAKGEYLVFLGADETLYPEALEVLARELDENPSLDWIMGNSLITEVDKHGLLVRDVMAYTRDGASKSNVYLETCYLSWVGGMYRKSIHERFGYYDESFRAAGDTEFKNRILSHLNVKFIPQMLGLFLNYPEERTTQSPNAEIEDLRAWYIHRTPAGVRYIFDDRPIAETEELFFKALGDRKSFCLHLSSDIELASYLADYLLSRKSRLASEEVSLELREYLKTLRSLEYMEYSMEWPEICALMLKVERDTQRIQECLERNYLKLGAKPDVHIFNDNRYEQHSYLWKTV